MMTSTNGTDFKQVLVRTMDQKLIGVDASFLEYFKNAATISGTDLDTNLTTNHDTNPTNLDTDLAQNLDMNPISTKNSTPNNDPTPNSDLTPNNDPTPIISLPKINSETFKLLLDWIDQEGVPRTEEFQLFDWEKKLFMPLEARDLCDLVQAAELLGLDQLIEVVSSILALKMKGKSVEQVKYSTN